MSPTTDLVMQEDPRSTNESEIMAVEDEVAPILSQEERVLVKLTNDERRRMLLISPEDRVQSR